jgi:hypothetical protein
MTTDPKTLAREMREFLSEMPKSLDLNWALDEDYIFYFEVPRVLLIRDIILKRGFKPEDEFQILDVGYLHGLIPEFIHRFFPKARFTICDRPESPVFHDPVYQEMIRPRTYLKLVPCDIKDVASIGGKFQVMLLGEMIEHVDPTLVVASLQRLRKLIAGDGVLIISTPNGSGFYNCLMGMGAGVMAAPIPHPTMGYGHIHLWSPKLLDETAVYCGWNHHSIDYYHGREAEQFAEVNRRWVNLKGQIFMRLTKLVGDLKPARKGFFIAAYKP